MPMTPAGGAPELNRTAPRSRSWAHLAVALLVCLWLFPGSVHAQGGNWWDGIRGFGSPDYSGKKRNQRRQPLKPDKVDDLRPNEIPWRSDEMISYIDRAIGKYQRILAKGGWPLIPGNRMMRPGDDDQRVPALRRRLRVTGELKSKSGYFNDFNFDSNLEAAVVRFQKRNGLRPTGRVDRPTLAALNYTTEQRLDQLRLNRTRILELLQQPIEERYVLVNSAAFQLEAVERYQVVQRHRVIVGRPERQTPSLKAMIKGVNFFPYWKVPDSVAQLDLIPRLMKEPDYLYKEQIRVVLDNFNGPEIDPSAVDWSQADTTKIKFRQDPGPQNALGLVRIDMQNPEGVYMHDTPMKPLFKQRVRPFSAGCVRVQDVFQLVEWLTRYEPGWEVPGQVEAVLRQGQAVDLEFSRPVPVYFTYITAWAEPNGEIQFRSDIYGRDGKPVTDVYDPDAPPPPPQALAP